MTLAALWIFTLAAFYQTMRAVRSWVLAALKAYAAAHELEVRIGE